jgi:hypothetical protein
MDAQTTLSTWAVKTAILLEGMDPEAKRGYSQLQRERLRLRSAIPWRTSIWLAAAADADLFMSTKSCYMGASAEAISGFTVTMAFGALVLQVLTMRVPQDVGPNTLVTADVRRGSWGEATIQIWPPREVASWPPKLGLNGELGVNLFAERFSTTDWPRDEIDTLII